MRALAAVKTSPNQMLLSLLCLDLRYQPLLVVYGALQLKTTAPWLLNLRL